MAHLSTRQIKQLLEIDHSGEGIKDEVQALIARLTSGGVGAKSEDPREAQAKRLYDRGFGGKLSFEEYLESIPAIPDFPTSYAERFPELVLVDTRLPITKICELLDIEFSGNDETYVDFDPKTVKTDKVYWIRMQNGKKNNGKSLRSCRLSFAEDEFGLSVYEGLAYFVQKSIQGRVMDLPGSVHCSSRDDAAHFDWFLERPRLSDSWFDYKNPRYGSASRGK